jgi:glutamate racemase
LQQKVKMIVVACNTITVTCLKELQDLAPVPVIGVIDPVVEYIARVSAGKVAILATPVTVKSGVYGRKLRQRRADMTVWEKSCPAFVPLIEQGLASSIAAEALVEAALADMPADVDTIQLGCTHYRMLRPAIAAQVQPGVQIVDSAASTAQEVQRVLGYLGQLQQGRELRDEFYFTSLTDRMLKSGRQMFGGDIVANSHKLTLRLLAQSPQMLCSANQCPVRSGQSKV